MKTSLAPIISNQEVSHGVYLMWLECPDIAASARPGQFVMVRCGEDTLLRRPLSLHNVDETKTRLALLFAVVGKGTEWLSQRKAGDNIDLFGPLGNGFTIRPDAKNLLLVAGGMGIAPLSFWGKEAARDGYSVRLLAGTQTADGVCPESLLPIGMDTVICTEDGTLGDRGLVTSLLLVHADWADQVFACGPIPMYKTMAQMSELKGKPVQVSLEIMMGCGFGVCYGCTIKMRTGLKQVCQDGPVFELEDIVWEELD